ncbi:MAG TPA: type III-B CRISPR module RAMP protein Cmr1, partial [Candidatus Goldiibacteriota bacterium]|nr:type III-B CRISPR module RAMP protein Cmr1 [Candidatus Goldiibacteriota bacterium]
MIKKEFQIELLTPLFMHGAETKGEVELRGASIKGLLRYWWRVSRSGLNPAELLKKENEIFGSTESKSKVKIVIKDKKLAEFKRHNNDELKSFYKSNPGIKYLW